MKRILVTGADGMLGSNLVRELLKRNYTVRAFLQPGRQVKTLNGLTIEKYEGDLLDKSSVEAAMQDCQYVIHAAAHTGIWPTRSEVIRNVNLKGTEHIVSTAFALQVERLVFVGTANSYGFGSKQNPGTEKNPYAGAVYGLDYMDSKYQAHQLVLKYVALGLKAIVVNPTFMIGPYDSGPSSGAMIVAICKNKVKGYARGGRNYICVCDAVVGIANALTMGRIGEGYLLGNRNLNYKEIFSTIARVANVKAPVIGVPGWILLAVGCWASFIASISKKKPLLSYNMAKIAVDEHYFTAQKAVDELHLPQTPVEVGIKESIDWFRANGYI